MSLSIHTSLLMQIMDTVVGKLFCSSVVFIFRERGSEMEICASLKNFQIFKFSDWNCFCSVFFNHLQRRGKFQSTDTCFKNPFPALCHLSIIFFITLQLALKFTPLTPKTATITPLKLSHIIINTIRCTRAFRPCAVREAFVCYFVVCASCQILELSIWRILGFLTSFKRVHFCH